MITAAFRVMLISLRRDRAALVMAFVLPTVIFMIFAAIFSGAIGDRIRIHLGLVDLARTATTERLMTALEADTSLRIERLKVTDLAGATSAVRRGDVDAALVLRGDLDAPVAGAPPEAAQPVILIENPARALATPIALGQLQRILNEALPDVGPSPGSSPTWNGRARSGRTNAPSSTRPLPSSAPARSRSPSPPWWNARAPPRAAPTSG